MTMGKRIQWFSATTVLVGTIAGIASNGAAAPYRNGQAVFGDFNGDGKQELTVWRPSNGTWYMNRIYTNTGTTSVQWGQKGDTPTPGDYDFDRKTDPAIFRPSEGKWYIKGSTKGNATVTLGNANSVPVPADYTCDGRTDPAVWDRNTGWWNIALTNWPGDPWRGLPPGVWKAQWGQMGDLAVPGDYDGDGCDDFAIWRESTGTWWVWFQWKQTYISQQWGQAGDIPLPIDVNGDSKTDFVVYRPSNGTWYELYNNGSGTWVPIQWGQAGDVPVPGDYDSDGLTDLVVWRPSEMKFYVNNPYTGSFWSQWGIAGDVPIGLPVPILQQALPAPTTPTMPTPMPTPTPTTGNAVVFIRVPVVTNGPCPGVNIAVEGKATQTNVGAMAQATLQSGGWECQYRALFQNVTAGSRWVGANSYPAVCTHMNVIAGQTNTYTLWGGQIEDGCPF